MDNTPVFNTIKSFVNDLNEIYGSRQRSLALYNRLLSKTRIDHIDAVEKHVKIFKQFNITNREGIIEKNKDKFVEGTVKYNDRVYINIKHIIATADEDSKKVIWTHLLVISAYLDPVSGAKDLLKKNKSEMPDFSSMGDMGSMLTNMITTLQSSVGEVGPDASPMDVFGKIMSSGAFSQVLNMVNGGMENGQIDMAQMMSMAQGMLGQMGGKTGSEGGAPDLSGIFKQLGMDGDQLQQMTQQIENNVGKSAGNTTVEIIEK